jgi:hypothetical protein
MGTNGAHDSGRRRVVMNKGIGKIIILAVLLLGLTACATPATKEYAGPILPGSETALVEAGPYTHFESFDGQAIGSLRLTVIPGTHVVTIRPAANEQPMGAYLYYSKVSGTVQFAAEAGHRYLVYVDYMPQRQNEDETGTGFIWIGHVLDRTTGKKIAKTDQFPLGAEPRGWPTGMADPGIFTK